MPLILKGEDDRQSRPVADVLGVVHLPMMPEASDDLSSQQTTVKGLL